MLYDNKNEESIISYAKNLIGMKFIDILNNSTLSKEQYNKYSNPNRKGGLGNLIEEVYFKYKANSSTKADFCDVGIELKVSPYEIGKNGEFRVGERLVIGMIDYNNPIESDFFKSHLWDKLSKILIVYYERDKALKSNLEYRIGYVDIFTPSDEDLEIIKNDYHIITSKIKNGNAHLLSEGDTQYLGACTKGANASLSMTTQYYNSSKNAKTRAFSLKQRYMKKVLSDIIKGHNYDKKS